jgi:hypothetical protein
MKRIALFLFTIAGLSAADAMTVDPSGKVGIGTATPTSTLDVAGTATATNIIVNRASQAAATEAVRGDDPRMANARPANGGNAATIGGLAPSAFVATTEKGAANGVATLNASGQIPAAQLPIIPSGRGIQFFTQSGTFTVPAGVTELQVIALGGGGGGGAYASFGGGLIGGGGGAGAYAWVKLTNLAPTCVVTIGAGGTCGVANGESGGPGGQTSFGSAVLCGGGAGGISGNSGRGGVGSTTGQGIVIPGAIVLYGLTGASGTSVSNKVALNKSGASTQFGNGGTYIFPFTHIPASGYGAGGAGESGSPGTSGLCIVMW